MIDVDEAAFITPARGLAPLDFNLLAIGDADQIVVLAGECGGGKTQPKHEGTQRYQLCLSGHVRLLGCPGLGRLRLATRIRMDCQFLAPSDGRQADPSAAALLHRLPAATHAIEELRRTFLHLYAALIGANESCWQRDEQLTRKPGTLRTIRQKKYCVTMSWFANFFANFDITSKSVASRQSFAASVQQQGRACEEQSKDANRSTPARAPEAISVRSTDYADVRPSSANCGKVYLFAPGEFVALADLQADAGYKTDSGTSFAAPLVAGAAAIHLHVCFRSLVKIRFWQAEPRSGFGLSHLFEIALPAMRHQGVGGGSGDAGMRGALRGCGAAAKLSMSE